MTTVAHKTLSGTDLHENKGAAAATDDYVATATSGATVWKKLTASNLTGTGNPFGGQLYHLQDQKASGTLSGTFSAGAWRTRTLNTELTAEISGASLSSNQITLPAGTYYLDASAEGYLAGNHKTKWYNVTDGSDVLHGTVAATGGTESKSSRSFVSGRFTIAGSKVFELQHRCSNTNNGDGFGAAATFSVVEVYADVKIWKVG